jgi:hypothetical protein
MRSWEELDSKRQPPLIWFALLCPLSASPYHIWYHRVKLLAPSYGGKRPYSTVPKKPRNSRLPMLTEPLFGKWRRKNWVRLHRANLEPNSICQVLSLVGHTTESTNCFSPTSKHCPTLSFCSASVVFTGEDVDLKCVECYWYARDVFSISVVCLLDGTLSREPLECLDYYLLRCTAGVVHKLLPTLCRRGLWRCSQGNLRSPGFRDINLGSRGQLHLPNADEIYGWHK